LHFSHIGLTLGRTFTLFFLASLSSTARCFPVPDRPVPVLFAAVAGATRGVRLGPDAPAYLYR
jgi:hypothetical protein